jgi:hypothetical protein
MPDVLATSAPRADAPQRAPAVAERLVLLVAPWFPPSAFPPAHRARLFARHLAAFGWRPIVVTVRPEAREEPPEDALLTTVDPALRVELVRAMPAALTRRIGIGDIALRAMPFLVARVARLARAEGAAAICLLVPPWYLLLAAPLLKRLTGVPIVVDYIDPWVITPQPGLKSRVARLIARALEGWALQAVDGIFAVSAEINRRLVERFPRLAAVPREAAPYGLEPTDFVHLAPRAPSPGGASERAEVLYIGAVSAAMEPVLDAVLESLAHLRRDDPRSFARLRLSLVGTSYQVDERTTPRSAAGVAARRLEGTVSERLARIPFGEALRATRTATANLIIGDMTAYYAASKLMPMLASGRPIVALLEEGSEPARLLRRLGAAGLVTYSATDPARHPRHAAARLAEVFASVARGELAAVEADFDDPLLRGRTARAMTEALAGVLDRSTSTSRRTST